VLKFHSEQKWGILRNLRIWPQPNCHLSKPSIPTSQLTIPAFRQLPMCLKLTNDSEVMIVESCRYYWKFLFEPKEVTYWLWNLGLNEARSKETLNIKVIGNFINSLKRVKTQNFDSGGRNNEVLNLGGFFRWDFESKSFFSVFWFSKLASWCNMNVWGHATCRPYTFLIKIKVCEI
jgi:hypothetical protein